MKLKITVITLFLLLTTLTTTATAEEVDEKIYIHRIEQTKSFDFDVSQVGSEYTIMSVYLNDIAFNSSQTLLLDAYGKNYMLTITSSEEGVGAWKTFWVNLTYPNGTTVSKRVSTFLEPFATDYDVKVQYYVRQVDNPVLDVDIYISGLLEFKVIPDYTGTFNLSYFVWFNRVQGSSTTVMNVEIFYTTEEGLKEIINKTMQNPFYLPPLDTRGITTTIWDTFLSYVSQIPVAGEYLADGLDFMAVMVGESFFYIKLFFVENWEITVLTFEAFAMMYAMQSRSIFTIFRRYYHFHEAALLLMFNIIKETLNLIWRLIQAVGSLIPFT